MSALGRWTSFLHGARAISPILLGVAPFGVVTGLTARDLGFGMGEALGLSTLIFAGAAQLATIELLTDQAPVWAAILTATAINLRMSMYSASLQPYLAHKPRRHRLLAAYLITDHTFAVSVAQYQRQRNQPPIVDVWWFYLGNAMLLWLVWQLATVTGALLAASMPDWLPISFAIPLTFLGLLVPSITDKPRIAAALTGGLVTIAALGLPANLGMPIGAVAGVIVGTVLTVRRQSSDTTEAR